LYHYVPCTARGFSLAIPTEEQLQWTRQEIGVLIHFDIATFINDSNGCDPQQVPDPSIFNPYLLNTDQWVETIQNIGAKYAVLVAKHNCGFVTWPTAVNFPNDNFTYTYSVNNSKWNGDVVGQFVDSCHAKGIKTGFYYSVMYNSFLNVNNGLVQNGTLQPGQVRVTQELYNRIVLEQLTELWTRYGSLTEIWFDGGYTDDLKDSLQELLLLQPHATAFNGFGISKHPVRWIGNEAGYAPDPNWSTGSSNDGGDPMSPDWCPAECDTTLQNDDRWFYHPENGLRNLSTLIDVYHTTVGRNCMLMLDLTPDRTGLIPAPYVARYKQLGDFIRSCYGSPPQGGISVDNAAGQEFFLNFTIPTPVDRVVIQENQKYGQSIRKYFVMSKFDSSSDQWEVVSNGTSVGNKKIDIFSDPIMASSIRLKIVQSVGETTIYRFAAYLC